MEAGTIEKWVENLEKAYQLLPEEVLKEIQPSLDGTLGRAVKSVSRVLGEEHVLVQKLKAMVKGPCRPRRTISRKRNGFRSRVRG